MHEASRKARHLKITPYKSRGRGYGGQRPPHPLKIKCGGTSTAGPDSAVGGSGKHGDVGRIVYDGRIRRLRTNTIR